MRRLILCTVIAAVLGLALSSCASADYYNEGRDGFSEASAFIIDSVSDLVTLQSRVNNGEEAEGAYYGSLP